MIRERKQKSNDNKCNLAANESNENQHKKIHGKYVDGILIEDVEGIIHPEFKTYQEESAYVVKLLKAQGTDIYEENRSGGMYLKSHSSDRNISKFFSSPSKIDNKENQKTNNNEDEAFAEFFK